MIGAFIFDPTNEALIHELGCSKPRMPWELLDLATSHAFGEVAFGQSFANTRVRLRPNPRMRLRTTIGDGRARWTARGATIASLSRQSIESISRRLASSTMSVLTK